MLAVLVTVPTVTQKSHLLSASSNIARHLLDFIVQEKITEADALTIHLDATPSRLLVPPTPSSPHFYTECPFCCNPPSLSWLGTGKLVALIKVKFGIVDSTIETLFSLSLSVR